MEFKESIKAYQENGDPTIILNVIEALDLDFMRRFGRERVMDGTQHGGVRIYSDRPEHYIAYSIKAMESLVFNKLSEQNVIPPAKKEEFQRLLSIIIMDIGIELKAEYLKSDYFMNYYHINDELLEDIAINIDEILIRLEQMYDRSQPRYFMDLYDFITSKLQSMKELKKNVRDNVIVSTRKALEKSLKYVDVNKSEQEIVKYINQTFATQFADDEVARNGLLRIQRINGADKRVGYVVKKVFPKNQRLAILGYDYYEDRHVLTGAENKLLDCALRVVEKDFEIQNLEGYSCDTFGTAIIKRKYLAEKLGRSYDSVRKTLSRIEKKLRNVTKY
ncbi:hypothetical protein Q0N12_16380 [Rossellomorea marisflavi]|uniref:hypothetical protein n=1 Tax=Rossellomorea marisflavi TaxID=189381 RepID=UPI00345B2744